jgi:hypothetical protein
MGKKKDKLAAQQQQQQQQQVPWKSIDKDPLGFLVAPEVGCLHTVGTMDSMCTSWTASTLQLHQYTSSTCALLRMCLNFLGWLLHD